MKKTLAILCAFVLVLSICVAGFAENIEPPTSPVNPPEPPMQTEPTTSTPVVPVEPDPPSSEPESSEPASSEPASSEPASSEPASSEPASSEPASSEPASSEPESSNPSSDPSVPTWTEPPTQPIVTPTTPPTTGFPKITKNPTSESVREGGFAEFVARADNCTSIIWHLQSPGGGTDVLAQNAPIRFPGLIVTGLESERLGLDRIPKELNEWRVRAEFVGPSGNVWSEAAVISVMSQELEAPTIQSQPKSASLNSGESTVLRVDALTSEQGTTLTYQWYKNTVNSNVGGRAILGATSDTYTPDFVQGTTYYYCAVRCTDGSEISVATKTSCAAVTYVSTGAETLPTVSNTENTTAATLAPWGTVETETTEETLPTITTVPTRSNTLLVIVVAVIVVIAVLGIVATVLILKFYGVRDDYEEPAPRPARRAQQEPRKQPKSTKQSKQTPSFSNEEEEWDDLSDLGDLSIYFDDDDDLNLS